MVSMTRGHLLVLGRSCGLNIHTDRQTIQVTPNIRERTPNTPATINQAENNPNKNKLHYMRMHNIFFSTIDLMGANFNQNCFKLLF